MLNSYRWVALSNTTIGVLIVTINMSILLIALPDIFRGIGIDPLAPGNVGLLLWLIMGYLVVTAVLVVSFGRLGDLFGRTRMYNLGFAVFTVFSVLLAVTWMQGTAGALWLISMRVLQGVGGALLLANSTAILTDAFPAEQRGLALGVNQVAGIAGSFLGLVVGGVLAPHNWRLIFLVSVPVGLFGTAWAYAKLRETRPRRYAGLDWWGNVTFAVGLVAVLVGITYGIQPYAGHTMGWTSPLVLGLIVGGVAVLGAFAVIETRAPTPMFDLSVFRIRAFTAGNVANLLAALGRGGLQFILIIWLQGIWLPQHGYDFAATPLWAGIYMLPLTVGFLVAGPAQPGRDHEQPAAGGARGRRGYDIHVPELRDGAVDRGLLLDVDPRFGGHAARRAQHGPHRARCARDGGGAGCGAAPGEHVLRGAARGQPRSEPARPRRFAGLSPQDAAYLTGRAFFPQLIAGPFAAGLTLALGFAAAACLVAAVASALRGRRYIHREPADDSNIDDPGATETTAAA
jgi:MFS family permease